MTANTPDQLHIDRSAPVIVHAATLAWTPSPQPGVDRRFLEREGAEVARATSLVRYAAGSVFPAHIHQKGEEYLVLDGVFSDEQGHFGAGTYVRNPPGSRHAPYTRKGCVIFVKLRQMRDDERDTTVRPANSIEFHPAAVPGLSRAPLFECAGTETVGLEQMEAGTRWQNRDDEGGEEILVLDGTLDYGTTACPPLTWLRIPPGMQQSLFSANGCRYWVKRGHLNLRP